MKSNHRKAFTLVELLTVIAIIGILAGFLFPSIHRARAKAKMANCANNLLQFAHAIDLFKIENDDYPNWLSNLYPSYISSKEMYLCPADYCQQGPTPPYNSHRGADGGKPWWWNTLLDLGKTVDLDITDDTQFNKQVNHPRNSSDGRIDYCSYLYEFCNQPCSWNQGYTWKEARTGQMAGHSSVRRPIPLVSCFWHQKRSGGGGNKYVAGRKDVISVAAKEKNIFYTDASNATKEHLWK